MQAHAQAVPLLRRALLGLLPIAVILLLWQWLATSGRINAALLPSVDQVVRRFFQQFGSVDFRRDTVVTLLRLFGGFGLAAVAGIALGLWAARSRLGDRLVMPVVRVLAPVPKVALYPAFILILGFDHASKIALVVADAVFPILLATVHGARSVDRKLIWSALAAGTPRRRIATRVVLPAAMPSILTGCRIGLLIACVVVFLAEMITSTDGLGHQMVLAARAFRTVDMFVPLIAISLLGLVLNAVLEAAGRRLLRGRAE